MNTRMTASSSPAIAAWSARRSCAGCEAEGSRSSCCAATRRARPARSQAAVDAFFARRAPDVRVPRRGQGRRHPRQRQLPGRLHLRQPDDRDQRDRCGLAQRRAQAAVPRLVLHLPASSRRSRCARTACSPGRSSRPTSGMRSPRSPASSSARPTAASTAATSSRPCRPTSTGRATTSTSQNSHVLPALIRKFHEAKAARARRRSSCGAPARRGASSCTSTTWPMPACS